MQAGTMLYVASTWVLPVLLAVTLHEAAHGFVAHLLGDDTAYRLGRVSFNPLKHVAPFGTILMPAILLLLRSPFLFGYAKPVPVNFQALKEPRRDMVLVAAAGPATNIALATLAALLFHIASYLPPGTGSCNVEVNAHLGTNHGTKKQQCDQDHHSVRFKVGERVGQKLGKEADGNPTPSSGWRKICRTL
jgi:hypothetical protein